MSAIQIDTPKLAYLFSADARGYISVWNIEKLREICFDKQIIVDINTLQNELKFMICWKAHNNAIVDLIYNSTNKTLLSASLDESVRIWQGHKGNFIGFLGQSKPISIPNNESRDFTQPYDVSEPPTYGNSKHSKLNKDGNGFDGFPLVLDKTK